MIEPAEDRDRVNRRPEGVDVIDLIWHDESLAGLLRVEFDIEAAATTAAIVVAPADRAPIAVVSTDLALPTGALEMRGPGIWLELTCEVPLDHWTVGLEAYGVTVDDGDEISAETRGDRTPLGLDIDLDTVAPGPVPIAGGFSVPLRVHGEVLWGRERREIDCGGARVRGGHDVAVGDDPVGARGRLRLGTG